MKKTSENLEMSRLLKSLMLAFMLIPIAGLYSQNDSTITRLGQITLISPLGTNGLQSPQVTNMFSLNVVAGYAGGVKGMEIGGCANVIRNDMDGLQLAGFANLVKGNTSGVQMAGFINLNKDHVDGAQIAGFTNIVSSGVNAIQISGFSNIVRGKVKGAQIAGFTNIASSDITAVQISGFANIANGKVKGSQVAGFLNYNKTALDGLQLGVVNYSKKVKGLQLGVFNVADTIENGVAIGVFSFVKNGYKAVEISASETIHGIVSLKTGTNAFYNIVSLGTNFRGEKTWSLGYGIGTLLTLTPRVGLSIEAHSFHINEKEIWTNEMNMLNKLAAGISYDFSERFSLFGGASANVAISELKDNEGNLVGSSLIPWYTYNENHNRVNIKLFAGFNFGLRMKI